MAKKKESTEAGKSEKRRYLGWQLTPIQQAMFGRSTKGGSRNAAAEMKYSTGPEKTLTRKWFVLDAAEAPIGRLASVAATILMGKHLPTFTPSAGSGDYVAVINSDKAYFTSNKNEKKIYYHHSGYIGGLKSRTAGEALKRDAEDVIHGAVYGMMPKTYLSRKQLKHLNVISGVEHKLDAWKPTKISLKSNKGLQKKLVA